jgi:hypothetical protein
MTEHEWEQAGTAPHETVRKDGSTLLTGHTVFTWECPACGTRTTTKTMSTTTLHIPRPHPGTVEPADCHQTIVDQVHDL